MTRDSSSRSRVVAISGASGGIGRATAVEFAGRGDRLALVARGQAGLEAAAEQVRGLGAEVLVVPTDVADPDQVEAAVARIEREMGPIDVWVNVAFSSVFAPFGEIDPEEYRRATEVSYLGYVYSTMSVLRRMQGRDRGTIVQVGSALAYRGIPLQTAYCGAKHAIQGFHEALRCELLHEHANVNVTMVQMPAVNTPQFDWLLSGFRDRRSPLHRSTSLRSPPGRSRMRRTTRGAGSTGSGRPRSPRSSPMRSSPASSTGTSRGPASPHNRPTRPGRRPAGEPVGARRRSRRPRLRGSRKVRRAGPRGERAAVAGPPVPASRGSCRRCCCWGPGTARVLEAPLTMSQPGHPATQPHQGLTSRCGVTA